MTFDPKSFLDLATKLFYDPNYREEGSKYRTCVSRAYYAAHLFTKEKLKEIGVKINIERNERKGIIHEKVIDALSMKNKELGDMLANLREKRGDADYVLNAKFAKYGTGLYISNAEYIIDEVDKFEKPKNK